MSIFVLMFLLMTIAAVMADDNVTAGALESSLDILLRFQSEITKEKKDNDDDERARLAECAGSRLAPFHNIATAEQAEGDLIPPSTYAEVLSSLGAAIKNARQHYLNATAWAKQSSQVYVHTTEELEHANSELQDMESRHDGVVNVLDNLMVRVGTHQKSMHGSISALPGWGPKGLLEVAAKHIRQQNFQNQHITHLVTSLFELGTKQKNDDNDGNGNSGWHEEVIRLSKSISTAVDESKTARTKPLQSIVNTLTLQLRRDGIEMKRALEAKSISSEALLTAKHSKDIIEKQSMESDKKRVHFLNVTAKSRTKLNNIDEKCNKERKDWSTLDISNDESLETLKEFITTLSEEKHEQESKLEQAVAMMGK